MAPLSSSPVNALAAPSGDGDFLIWPAFDRLAALIEENRRRRAKSEVVLLDRPLSQWEGSPRGTPLIFTGHQPAFFHPGVWAKNVVATALARQLGGRAVFLAVDSDAPDRLALEWPRKNTDHYEIAAASPSSPLQGRCYEQFPPLSSSLCDAFAAQLDPPLRQDTTTPLAAFLAAFRKLEPPHDETDYVSRWVSGMNAIDRAVGVPSPTIERISDRFDPRRSYCDGTAIDFFAHVLLHVESFAAAYNGALMAYRSAHGIKGDRHPIPNLLVTTEKIELPFWILGAGLRQRLFVSRECPTGDTLHLWSGNELVGTVAPKKLLGDPLTALRDELGSPQIRPRALTLTMYSRLLACDLFIHGIGGAKYDQIADEVIRRFFGCDPPAYACVSATMRLPLWRQPVTYADYEAGRRRLRDLRYNPQRYFDGKVDRLHLASLLTEREKAVTDSERLRAESPADHAARRDAYHAIRRANGAMLEAIGNPVERYQQESALISAALSDNRIADYREWFVGLYPTARLIELCGKLVRNISISRR